MCVFKAMVLSVDERGTVVLHQRPPKAPVVLAIMALIFIEPREVALRPYLFDELGV